MEILKCIENQTLVLNILSIVLVVIIAVILPLSFFASNNDRRDFLLKVVAILIVVSMCFMCNHPAVYALAVFIVATSITSLDFLEKLAAIFSKNDRYWQYRERVPTYQEQYNKVLGEVSVNKLKSNIHSQSDETEISNESDSKEKEALMDDSKIKGIDRELLMVEEVNKMLAFEAHIIKLLGHPDKGIFKPSNITGSVTYTTDSKEPLILDGIAEGPNHRYIIEIKGFVNIYELDSAIRQVRGLMQEFQKQNECNRFEKSLRALIVIYDHPAVINSIENDIGILRYDKIRDTFVNGEEIKNWI